MGSQEALLSGASIGLAIAAPVGPMAITVMRRTLAGGILAGVTTGAGASTVHLIYATLANCGLDELATHLQNNRNLLNMAIALTLLLFAARILRHPTAKTECSSPGSRSLLGDYASAIAFNLVNPMTFALLFSAIAAIAGSSFNDKGTICALAAGVFAGSIAWWGCLVGVTAFIGIRPSPRSIRTIDVVAGTMMVALAISAFSRVV